MTGPEARTFPQRTVGELSTAFGIESGLWVSAHVAAEVSGANSNTLREWARKGLLSYRQDEPRGGRWYQRPEMELIAEMRNGHHTRLTLSVVRQKMEEHRARTAQ